MISWRHATVAVCALALLAGCVHAGERGAGAPAVFRFTEGEDVDNLNFALSTESLSGDLSLFTQGYFFTFDRADNPVPELCVEVPTQANHLISADGKTITYKLRPGVRWQDGAPFTSADVRFTVKTLLDPNFNARNRMGYDQITALQTPDAHTVVVRLRRPYAPFVALFLTPGGVSPVMPQHLLAHVHDLNHAAYNALPIGLGPFRIARWERGSEIVMDAFDGYWGGKPKLRRVVYRVITDDNSAINQLRSRELDAFVRMPNDEYAQARNIPGMQTLQAPTSGYEHLDFNTEHPILDDVRVRRALAHAVDVKTIWQKVDHGLGYPACSPIPHFSWAYDAGMKCYPYDLNASRRLLDAAGWGMGADGLRHKDGKTLSLTLVSTVGNLTRDESVVLMQSSFRQIGVELSYHRFQANELFAKRTGILDSGKFDIALNTWTPGPDPGQINDVFTCAARPPEGQNESRYCNPQADTVLNDALGTYDRARRRADYVKFQELLGRDVPMVVLYQVVANILVDRAFTGINPAPDAVFSQPAQIAR